MSHVWESKRMERRERESIGTDKDFQWKFFWYLEIFGSLPSALKPAYAILCHTIASIHKFHGTRNKLFEWSNVSVKLRNEEKSFEGKQFQIWNQIILLLLRVGKLFLTLFCFPFFSWFQSNFGKSKELRRQKIYDRKKWEISSTKSFKFNFYEINTRKTREKMRVFDSPKLKPIPTWV